MDGVNIFDESVGLLRRATIVKYIPDRDRILVKLATGQSAVKGTNPQVPFEVNAPHSMFFNSGLYIGSLPVEGTPVIIGQGNAGWQFVSFLTENLNAVPDLKLGELLIRANDKTKVTLNVNNEIVVGNDTNRIHIDTNNNYVTTNFNAENHFTQAARKVEGVVKRDVVRNKNIDDNNKLDSDIYSSLFKVIAMDPTISPTLITSGATKNPPFVESRETLYEFQYASNIEDDLRESSKYGHEKPAPLDFSFPNRRKNRGDTLSLSLVSPNYLMETVKGTVVDFYGNILDLNRYPLPIGKGFDQNTLDFTQSKDKVASFQLIKALERKSIAYHFEINARKDLSSTNGAAPDINSNDDYARTRSRFFMDIDKEGQFKINVPASSETGNISLLARYENYSTIGPEDNGNPNKQIYQGAGNNFDIYHDSFAAENISTASDLLGKKGSISLVSGDKATTVPQDRITGDVLNHGTPYHDILQTCYAHQNNLLLDFQAGEVDPLTVDTDSIPELKNVVSNTITISGNNAKAGGRSGQINLDGSLELNVGANTVDRQSLWLDTAGGMITNIGRDINGRSLMATMDGDFYLQVGGYGIQGDSRFADQNNGFRGGVLDLRIFTSGLFTHMIRCDDNGITILTPGNLAIHSKGDMTLTSDKDIRIECNTLTMQERMHLKLFGGSS